MGGREVREYTNLTDPKDKKWSGKGKERIDDEEVTFQRMVSKVISLLLSLLNGWMQLFVLCGRNHWSLLSPIINPHVANSSCLLITCPDRDLGFSKLSRCKRLLENVVATSMDEEVFLQPCTSLFLLPIAVLKATLLSDAALDSDDLLYLKEQMEAEDDAERLLKRTEKRAFAAFKQAVADTSQAPVPLPLRVEPKLKSGIRQQDILKRLVEVKPKRQKQSNGSGEGNQPSSGDTASDGSRGDTERAPEKEEVSPARVKPTDESKQDNPVTSLLLAYQSSDDDED